MCVYDLRCEVKQHEKPENCRYYRRATRQPRAMPPPPRFPSTPRGSTSASKPVLTSSQPDYRVPAAGAGVSVLDLLIWLLVLAFADAELTLGWMAAFVVAVFVPLGIAGMLTDKCGAWINDQTRRCVRGRPGPFRRCQDHRNQVVTAYDLAGLLAMVVVIVNAAAFFIDAA